MLLDLKTQILGIALATSLMANWGLFSDRNNLIAELDNANEKIKMYERAQALATEYSERARAAREAANAQAEQSRQITEDAISNNEDWGNVPLPDDIQRVLQQTIYGSGRVSAPSGVTR